MNSASIATPPRVGRVAVRMEKPSARPPQDPAAPRDAKRADPAPDLFNPHHDERLERRLRKVAQAVAEALGQEGTGTARKDLGDSALSHVLASDPEVRADEARTQYAIAAARAYGSKSTPVLRPLVLYHVAYDAARALIAPRKRPS